MSEPTTSVSDPDNWRVGYSRGDKGGLAVYTVLSLLSVFFAVDRVMDGEMAGGVCGLLLAIGLATSGVQLAHTVRRRLHDSRATYPRNSARLRNRELVIDRDGFTQAADVFAHLGIGVGFLILAGGVWTGLVSLPFTDTVRLSVYPWVAVMVGVGSVVHTVRTMSARCAVFTLSPQGIRFGGRRNRFRSWESISAVVPEDIKGDRREGAWLSLEPNERRDHLRVDETAIGAKASLWLIEQYHRAPELRDELSSSAVLIRLRAAMLETDGRRHV
ncbi:hypothetical protein [Gordonia sp. OPL2]|uniref:hypothetical protein n=1 Tax=Gordonia sp. OPL2 TaxID=2486274 RepID=UPI001654E65A|nr:hypothetical protein [Gordonia sp. OPL2]